MPAGTLVAEVVSQLSCPRGAPEHRPCRADAQARGRTPASRPCSPTPSATAQRTAPPRRTSWTPPATLKSLPELAAEPLLQPNGQGWLKSSAQMLQLGKEIIRAAGYGAADLKQLMAQTEALADLCRMDPVTDMGWKQPVVPEASVIGISQDPHAELVQRCEAGIGRRFPGISGVSRQGHALAAGARAGDHQEPRLLLLLPHRRRGLPDDHWTWGYGRPPAVPGPPAWSTT